MAEKKENPSSTKRDGFRPGDADQQPNAAVPAEANDQPDMEPATEPGVGSEKALATAQADLEKMRLEVTDLSNRLLRAQADFENYRRRMQKEKEDLAVFANQKLLLSLLPVLDNLERALATMQAATDDKVRQGVELTARSFRDIIGREGVTAIDAIGQPFDPNLHEAVATLSSDEHEDGTVLMEFQKGYKLGERVIRPSMVQVSKRD